MNTKIKDSNKKTITCQVCEKKFIFREICSACRNKDIHHERKVPKGACQQCLEKGLELTKVWNGKYYCQDCLVWNEEGDRSGIGIYCQRFLDTYCDNCGKCASCIDRKGMLNNCSTRNLMIEVLERPEFKALLSWEDDGFKQRYGEIMWELQEVVGWTPQQIQAQVNEDIRKKVSKRKFSRGT